MTPGGLPPDPITDDRGLSGQISPFVDELRRIGWLVLLGTVAFYASISASAYAYAHWSPVQAVASLLPELPRVLGMVLLVAVIAALVEWCVSKRWSRRDYLAVAGFGVGFPALGVTLLSLGYLLPATLPLFVIAFGAGSWWRWRTHRARAIELVGCALLPCLMTVLLTSNLDSAPSTERLEPPIRSNSGRS